MKDRVPLSKKKGLLGWGSSSGSGNPPRGSPAWGWKTMEEGGRRKYKTAFARTRRPPLLEGRRRRKAWVFFPRIKERHTPGKKNRRMIAVWPGGLTSRGNANSETANGSGWKGGDVLRNMGETVSTRGYRGHSGRKAITMKTLPNGIQHHPQRRQGDQPGIEKVRCVGLEGTQARGRRHGQIKRDSGIIATSGCPEGEPGSACHGF